MLLSMQAVHLEAGADPFACNGSGQLPDIAGLQDCQPEQWSNGEKCMA